MTFRRAAVLCVLAGACVPAIGDEQDSIDYRQHVMKTLQQQTSAIGMIIQKRAPAANLTVHAKVLALAAGTAKKTFETKAAGGGAKPEVWTNAADFAKRMEAMIAATDDLAKAAGGGPQAVNPKYQALMTTCKGCHDIYSVPPKK